MYRAQRRDTGWQKFQTTYKPYLASTPDLSINFGAKQKAFTTPSADFGLFNIASFIRAGRKHHVYTSQGLPDPPIAPVTIFYNQTFGDTMRFAPLPLPLPLPALSAGQVIQGDANVIRDPWTGKQWMYHGVGTFTLPSATAAVQVFIHEGVPR